MTSGIPEGSTVVVTGAGGFIGSHLVEHLAARGARVRAFVRYTSSGRWGWLDQSPVKNELEVLLGDVRDSESVERAVAGADIVFHLAALIGIPYSYEAPLSYVRTNVEGTLNVLRASLKAGVARVVQTSTSEVYGSARYVPIDEAHPLQGQSPYSASKIGADALAAAFHRSYGLPVATLRPFNTFGPRQSARAVIPTVLTQLLTGERVVLGSTAPTRDFMFVSDTVAAFAAIASADAAVGQVVNVGTGIEVSVADLVVRAAELLGREPNIVCEETRVRPPESEVDRLCADVGLARALLEWQPLISLDEGLQSTAAWIEAHLEKYRVDAYAV